MSRFFYFFIFFLVTGFLSVVSGLSYAQTKKIFVLRDNETENAIRAFAYPVIDAAGLESRDMRFYILSDERPNAFVTQDRSVFITLGMLRLARYPGEISGVIGHEIGHILSSHVAQRKTQRDITSRIAAASIVLSALSGKAELLTGSVTGVGALQGFYRGAGRADEQQADQTAAELMIKAQISPFHLARFTEKLHEREQGLTISTYFSTHPPTQDRISFLYRQAKNFDKEDAGRNKKMTMLLQRLQARITGAFDSKEAVFALYPEQKKDFISRYARLAFYQKVEDFSKARLELNALLKISPEDPFLHEIEGDLWRKQGKFLNAAESYQKALQKIPWSGLLFIMRGDVLFLEGQRQTIQGDVLRSQAAKEIRKGLTLEPDNLYGWLSLAKVEAAREQFGLRDLALAEAAWLRGNLNRLRKFATRAQRALKDKNTASWVRAGDLLRAAQLVETAKGKNG